jgi:uncharacterized membrane protein YeiH
MELFGTLILRDVLVQVIITLIKELTYAVVALLDVYHALLPHNAINVTVLLVLIMEYAIVRAPSH